MLNTVVFEPDPLIPTGELRVRDAVRLATGQQGSEQPTSPTHPPSSLAHPSTAPCVLPQALYFWLVYLVFLFTLARLRVTFPDVSQLCACTNRLPRLHTLIGLQRQETSCAHLSSAGTPGTIFTKICGINIGTDDFRNNLGSSCSCGIAEFFL